MNACGMTIKHGIRYMIKTISAYTTQLTKAVIVFIAAALGGCDAVIDCLDNDGPVFSTNRLEPATLNQVYEQTITASVENEPSDGRFDYEFDVNNGSLPEGVTWRQSGRQIVFSGTPTELGSFTIDINVEVDDGLNPADSGLCYRTRTRGYILLVKQDDT